MTTQNKMIAQRLSGFIKDYIEENGFKPSTLNCVRWAYEQGLQDPSRSEALDKVLGEVDEVLLKCWGQLEAGCKLSFEVEHLIDKIRELRGK